MITTKPIALIAILSLAVTTIVSAADKPLKVFILVGQSNMQGQAAEVTLKGMAADPLTKGLHDKLVDESGKPRVFEDVCMAAFSQTGKEQALSEKAGPLTFGFGGDLNRGDRMGPELAFGATMLEHVKEPILIIKTSWGGKSLNTDFCPPSALEAGLRSKEIQGIGNYYQLMLEHVNTVLADPGKYCTAYDPKQGYEIAGFVWFQGWNDMVDGNTYPTKGPDQYQLYSDLLVHFIRDVRKDFKAPEMPFVIGVMGTGGNPDSKNPFREAMATPAALPEFKGNVVAVKTAEYFDEKLGELMDRGWQWMSPKYDPENKYIELAKKLKPLQAELAEVGKIKDRAERDKKKSELQNRMEDVKYSPEEKTYIEMNRSNKGFHYDGSAKNYSRFGEAFAKALIDLDKD